MKNMKILYITLFCAALFGLLIGCGTSEPCSSELEGSPESLGEMILLEESAEELPEVAMPELEQEEDRSMPALASEEAQSIPAPEQPHADGEDTVVATAEENADTKNPGVLLERTVSGQTLWEITTIPRETFLRTYPETAFPKWDSGALNGTDYHLGSSSESMFMLRVCSAIPDGESQALIEAFIVEYCTMAVNPVCMAEPYYVAENAEEWLENGYYGIPMEEPETVPEETEGHSEAYDKVYGAGNAAGVSDEIKDAFVDWIDSQSGFMDSYGSWIWTFEDDSGGQLQLRCMGPEVTDETGEVSRMVQYLLYSGGSVSWGPSGPVLE